MKGFITERQLPEAEQVFPGISELFASLPREQAPQTFLDLVRYYHARYTDANSNDSASF